MARIFLISFLIACLLLQTHGMKTAAEHAAFLMIRPLFDGLFLNTVPIISYQPSGQGLYLSYRFLRE